MTVIVGAVPLNGVPSDKVPDIVPDPITAKVRVAEFPLQIAVVPLISPDGIELPSNSSAPNIRRRAST